MDVDGKLGAWREKVEAALAARLGALGGPPRLREAMTYSVLAGGKRLRPIFALAAAEACGAPAEQALGPGLALELVHTFSLIHDDLPCMDDDDLRRGRPTCHKAFDEATALLAGDALFALSFEVALEGLPAGAPVAAIVRALAEACGPTGMVGGQVLDLAGEGRRLGRAELEEIHRLTTGALLVASVELGALAAGASEAQLAALRTYGAAVGLGFQIIDDVLDVVGDREKLGKPVGGDARNEKSTFAVLLGVEGARAEARRQLGLALEALRTFGEDAAALRRLAALAIDRDR